MLLDLERNDLGRVCDYGTVQVDEMMVVEDYSHVIHIVSNVRGKSPRRDGMPSTSSAPCFPAARSPGCRKCGAWRSSTNWSRWHAAPIPGPSGILANTGDMDLNIIIRTFVIKDGMAHVQVGAGIVADSDPAAGVR